MRALLACAVGCTVAHRNGPERSLEHLMDALWLTTSGVSDLKQLLQHAKGSLPVVALLERTDGCIAIML